MLKFIKLIIIFLLMTTCVFAKNSRETLLVLDMANKAALPKKFRTTQGTLPDHINTTGLAELNIAGSAQFSKSAFEEILQNLRQKKIIVVDLRQESHGLLNSNAVSWYGWQNAANAALTPKQVEQVQVKLLDDLEEKDIAVVNKILKKSGDGGIQSVKPIEYVVHKIASEEDYVKSMGSAYKRIYVQDFHAPHSKEVDKFLIMMKEFPKGKWVYFHCRGGSGRTSTFMLMYDMLQNAKKVSFEDIMTRQVALGGKDLTILPEKNNFKYRPSVERLNFIKQFYQYAHDNHDNFSTSWSDWLKTH